jgi:hypothetical protein
VFWPVFSLFWVAQLRCDTRLTPPLPISLPAMPLAGRTRRGLPRKQRRCRNYLQSPPCPLLLATAAHRFIRRWPGVCVRACVRVCVCVCVRVRACVRACVLCVAAIRSSTQPRRGQGCAPLASACQPCAEALTTPRHRLSRTILHCAALVHTRC